MVMVCFNLCTVVIFLKNLCLQHVTSVTSWRRGFCFSLFFVVKVCVKMNRESRKRKRRDGFCHCSVCDQLPTSSKGRQQYDHESFDTGKTCFCNIAVLSKACWQLSRKCLVCENLSVDAIMNNKNRGNFGWFLNDTNIEKVSN